MTPEEAIRINEENEILQREDGFKESAKATQLGIEALKRELEWRRRHPHQSHLPFPGEGTMNNKED